MWQSLAFALVASGCHRSQDAARRATAAECEAYHAKFLALSPGARDALAQLKLDTLGPRELKLCQERMTSDVVTCVLQAPSLEAALACKPAVDIRPAEARHTPDECAAYVEHMRTLAASAVPDKPKVTTSMTEAARRACDGWLTTDRYRCVLKASTPHELAACPP